MFWVFAFTILIVCGTIFCLFMFADIFDDSLPLLIVSSIAALAGAALCEGALIVLYQDSITPHPIYELRKDQWSCTGTKTVQNPPTYIQSGKVMIPVDSGTSEVCTQYTEK